MYIVIMGGGKVGEYLASVLLGKGHEVAVLESDRDTADHLSVELQGEYLIINGDGCDSDFQEDAGIRKADVFVAVTGRDDDNLVACEIATRVFNVNRCIARVNNPKNRRIFREVGIESVSSTMLIANMIEEEALMGGVGGNAGLFTTARDMARFCEMILGGGTYAGRQVLTRKTVELFTESPYTEQGVWRGLGFDKRDPKTGELGGETRFACVDGPDFDGHKVDWDLAVKRNQMYHDFEVHKHEEVCNLFKQEVK